MKFWDTYAQRLLKSIKVSGAGYPVCMQFNPCDLCIAVGTSNKYVKYWELTDFTLVSSSNIENFVPRQLAFNGSGESCFVAYDDCTKVYLLDDEVKPKVLDIIAKPYRMVMDLKLSNDGKQLYCLDSNGFLGNPGGDPAIAAAQSKTNVLFMQHIDVDKINFNPDIKPVLNQKPQIIPPKDPVPRQDGIDLPQYRKASSSRGFE